MSYMSDLDVRIKEARQRYFDDLEEFWAREEVEMQQAIDDRVDCEIEQDIIDRHEADQ